MSINGNLGENRLQGRSWIAVTVLSLLSVTALGGCGGGGSPAQLANVSSSGGGGNGGGGSGGSSACGGTNQLPCALGWYDIPNTAIKNAGLCPTYSDVQG